MRMRVLLGFLLAGSAFFSASAATAQQSLGVGGDIAISPAVPRLCHSERSEESALFRGSESAKCRSLASLGMTLRLAERWSASSGTTSRMAPSFLWLADSEPDARLATAAVYKQVSAGQTHTCGLRQDETVAC